MCSAERRCALFRQGRCALCKQGRCAWCTMCIVHNVFWRSAGFFKDAQRKNHNMWQKINSNAKTALCHMTCVHDAQCTLCIVHNPVFIVHNAQCALCTMHNVHCSQCTMFIVHNEQCSLCTMHIFPVFTMQKGSPWGHLGVTFFDIFRTFSGVSQECSRDVQASSKGLPARV